MACHGQLQQRASHKLQGPVACSLVHPASCAMVPGPPAHLSSSSIRAPARLAPARTSVPLPSSSTWRSVWMDEVGGELLFIIHSAMHVRPARCWDSGWHAGSVCDARAQARQRLARAQVARLAVATHNCCSLTRTSERWDTSSSTYLQRAQGEQDGSG